MKLNRFEAIFTVIVIAVHLLVILAPMNNLLDRWFTTDDAFYYFQVARNISEGRGSSLDGFNLSNGYHPLWMGVLIPFFALARFDLFVPLRLVVFLSVLISLATGILLYRFLSRSVNPGLAKLAAVFWVLFPPIHRSVTQLGMESALNALCVIVLIHQTSLLLEKPISDEKWRDRFILGVMACFALFARLDNVFLILTIGLVLVFRSQRKFIFWLAYLLVGLISIYLAFFTRIGFPRFLTDFQSTLYAMVGIGVPIKLLFAFAGGMFIPVWNGIRKELIRVVMVSFTSTGLIGVILLILNAVEVVGSYPRLVVLLDVFFSVLLFLPVRWLAVRLVEKDKGDETSPLREFSRNFCDWFRRGAGYALPVVILLIFYLLLNLYWFGTPTPVSGQIKHWWGTIPDVVYGKPVNSIPALFGFFENSGQSPWWLLFLPVSVILDTLLGGLEGQTTSVWLKNGLMLGWLALLLAGLWLRIKKRGIDAQTLMIFPLLTACLLQILYYTGSYYVNHRPWYWVNHLILGVLLYSFSLDGWNSLVSATENKSVRLPAFSTVVMVAVGLWGSTYLLSSFALQKDDKTAYYLEEVERLQQHTPAGVRIGMPGGGTTAYFIRGRTIVNLDGLINSFDYFQHLKSGRGRDYLDQMGLDYVFGNPGMIEDSAPYYQLLEGRLEPEADILDFRLYRYRLP